MILLWADVWDGAIGPSDGVSDVLPESVRRCSSCVWSARDCTTSMVSAVTCCCCCWLLVWSLYCAGVAALCCRLCFGCCTRYRPGSARAYASKLRWQCTQLRGYYSRCVRTIFGVGSSSPVGRCGLAAISICSSWCWVVAKGPLVRVPHSARTGSVIIGTYSRLWRYLPFVSTSVVSCSSGLDGRAAFCVGVLVSGEAAIRWAWLLFT